MQIPRGFLFGVVAVEEIPCFTDPDFAGLVFLGDEIVSNAVTIGPIVLPSCRVSNALLACAGNKNT